MLFLNFHVQGTCENIFAVFLDFCSLDCDDQVGFSVIFVTRVHVKQLN